MSRKRPILQWIVKILDNNIFRIKWTSGIYHILEHFPNIENVWNLYIIISIHLPVKFWTFIFYRAHIKLKYYQQQQWEQEYINEAIGIITNTYHKNYKNNSSFVDDNLATGSNDQDDFFGIFETDNDQNEDELEEYLWNPQ